MDPNANKNKWTRALWEPNADIQANKCCVALGDVHSKNDSQLLLVDENCVPPRLKLFKGLRPIADSVLAEPPAGIASFISDAGSTDTPCLAVASGSSLLIYRNMKPYYRYNIPQMDILKSESAIWNEFKEGQIKLENLVEVLKKIQLEYSLHKMSFQTQQLLTLPSDSAQQEFVNYIMSISSVSVPLSNIQATCLATIPRNLAQNSCVDVIIVGTEQGSIYFIDSQAYTVLKHTTVPGTPVKILPTGQYDIEYKVWVSTREQDVYIIERNIQGEEARKSLYIREFPSDLICCGNQIVFATRKQRLIFFNIKGKRQFSMQFDDDITDIESFIYEPKQYNGVLVVIKNEIRLYVDNFLCDTIKMDLPVQWIKFGRMDREDGVLVISTKGGGLCVKIFRRVAVLNEKTLVTSHKHQQSKGIEPLKKSKTFIDQSLRERENPQLLHQIYQRDWFMIKFHTTKTFAALESGKTELVPTRDAEPIQISYDILGFGPRFKLIIKMISSTKLDIKQRWLGFVYNAQEYSFSNRIIPVPNLSQNQWFRFCTDIECLNPEKMLQEDIKIILCRVDWIRPVWMTTFTMPISETNVL